MSVQHVHDPSRIERAQHLLMHTGMNVTEVADALGYRDIFFFSRQFKQYTGRARRKSANASRPPDSIRQTALLLRHARAVPLHQIRRLLVERKPALRQSGDDLRTFPCPTGSGRT